MRCNSNVRTSSGAMLVIAVAGMIAANASPATSKSVRTVPCQEIAGHPAFPYVGDPMHPYRLVLGVIAVPPHHLENLVATHEQPWALWRKAGLVIRAGAGPVTITVPAPWRSRAAIIWGNGNYQPGSRIRFAGCAGDPSTGNAYAGGFLLRSEAACIPLVFRVADRTATIHFGLGRRCG
jgi:hypothetical protein